MYQAGDEFTIGWDLAEATCFASIHFVKVLTITNKYFLLVRALRSSPTISSPKTDQVIGIVFKAVDGRWVYLVKS